DGVDVTSEAVSNAGGSTLINPRLLDVQRIEIVKGPQSALYGRSAFAGAVQYVTKDPSDVLEGELFVDTNSEEDQEVRGSVSFPLGDNLGMLVNGLYWQSDGYYKNVASDDYVGDGEGLGGSVTFKWEPTDELGFKWRTSYSDDEFGPPPQVNLNPYNTIVDLGVDGNLDNPEFQQYFTDPNQQFNGRGPTYGGSGLIPGNLSSNCVSQDGQIIGPDDRDFADPDGGGSLTPDDVPRGPLDNIGCREKAWLARYYERAQDSDPNNTGVIVDLDRYPTVAGNYPNFPDDPNDPNTILAGGDPILYNQYNKQVASFFQGKIPDAGDLPFGRKATLQPNYQRNPVGRNTPDYEGTNKEVLHTSLVANWAVTENIEFTNYLSYIDADVTIKQDLSKYWLDQGRPDVRALDDAYVAAINAQKGNGFGPVNPDLRAYAPLRVDPANGYGPDGIHDGTNGFVEDSWNETTQLSEEIRMSWQIIDSLNFTTGVNYWNEEVTQTDHNNVLIAGGPQCYANIVNGFNSTTNQPDLAYSAPGFFQLNGAQDQCGNTGVGVAFWQKQGWQARFSDGPTIIDREVEHTSWYGSLDWDITEKWTIRGEARYVYEKNEVEGDVQTPCLDGSRYYSEEAVALDPSLVSGCDNSQPINRLETAAGGQPTGPSAIILCGQVGRCDRLGWASSPNNPYSAASPYWATGTNNNGWYNNAWWAYGWAPMPGNSELLERTDRYWTPKLTVEFFPVDDLMTYFSWSRGIKPGGFSLLTSGAFGLDANLDNNFDEIEFEPEELDVWELGAKSTLFDGRVRLNGAVFFQDFTDKQVTVQKVTGSTTGTEVVNISGSEIWGLEMDATWQIIEQLVVQVGYTYLDSEYTDYSIDTQSTGDISRIQWGNGKGCTGQTNIAEGQVDINGDPRYSWACQASFNGNELERSPKHALLVNGTWTDNLGDTGLDWFTEVNYRYQDTRYVEAFNIVEFQDYHLTDFRLGLTGDTWDAQLYVNNVFDDDTVITGGATPGLPTGSFGFGLTGPFPPQVNAGPKLPSDIYAQLPNPRIIGVRATLRFGQ
ncbi:MAG: TonB-dependent receptor domain-containing protein, partial [Gammaproteobacteria bacterium]